MYIPPGYRKCKMCKELVPLDDMIHSYGILRMCLWCWKERQDGPPIQKGETDAPRTKEQADDDGG